MQQKMPNSLQGVSIDEILQHFARAEHCSNYSFLQFLESKQTFTSTMKTDHSLLLSERNSHFSSIPRDLATARNIQFCTSSTVILTATCQAHQFWTQRSPSHISAVRNSRSHSLPRISKLNLTSSQ